MRLKRSDSHVASPKGNKHSVGSIHLSGASAESATSPPDVFIPLKKGLLYVLLLSLEDHCTPFWETLGGKVRVTLSGIQTNDCTETL